MQIYGPIDTGKNYTSPLLHTVLLTGLTPSTQYFYQCAPCAQIASSSAGLTCAAAHRAHAAAECVCETLLIVVDGGGKFLPSQLVSQ